MPSITLTVKYKKNTGLVLSPNEIRSLYFFGVNVLDSSGNEIPDETLLFYINTAQKEIENYLRIKFKPQLINDNGSYYRDNYMNGLPMIQTKYPVSEALSLTGFYKKVEQINYPQSWLSSHSDDEGFYSKRISIVPTSGAVVGTSQDVILTGITTSYYGSLGGYNSLPDYWQYQYVTGFSYKNIPYDIVNLVGMLASIPVFAIAGDLILGAGIASQSLSIDGLSQSINSTSSATSSGYGARVIAYNKQINETLKRVKNIYKGLSFTVL